MSSFPELLAPAGSMEALTAALRCGADAVYVGARQFSARANAENFDRAGLSEAAAQCHLAGAKLYLAINTLLFDSEFPALDDLLQTAADIGADGCIVQDLGTAAYIAKRLPTLRLHASTQLTIHSPAGLRFAKRAGFCRVVLARELSGRQIAEICAEAARCDMETEVFVHGAHCMSVSGQCWMSAAMGGRSANRGCCAQPCRLPFTADSADRNACALSLKDQSLVRHLPELLEMGVQSLKIEGRMKRPEYVAAAVTACRAALHGESYDLRELQAVFSRSGFTDGYYTGVRKDMFGTRRKEDVTAAQDVLRGLHERYQKPRKCAKLDAHYVLLAGQAASLTVTDGQSSVTVTGDAPQQAISRPTDLPQLQKQFEKLGDTIYTAGNLTAELAPGMMLPASALNAMRRQAAEAMDAARIKRNTPEHRMGERPEPPHAQQMKQGKHRFRLQIRRLDQLSELGTLADELDALLLPLHLVQDYLAGAQQIPIARCQIVPPRFICDEQAVIRLLRSAKEAGFTQLACQNAADIETGTALGFSLHGTLGLHVTNGFAAAVLEKHGLTDALCAPETPKIPAQMLPLGLYAYGRLPLMLTRNCPVQAQIGCARCRHTLTDRKDAAVYTDCTRLLEKPDYAELFNAVPVWLADRPQTLSGAAFGLLSMTDESAARVREVLLAYLRGEQGYAPAAYTRGLRVG